MVLGVHHILKKIICFLAELIIISLAIWIAIGLIGYFLRTERITSVIPIRPIKVAPTNTTNNRLYWVYSPVKSGEPIDTETAEKALPGLIGCESEGVSVKRVDSNGYYSYGILQYQSSTWNEWSKSSGITGDPMNPNDAIKMYYWAASHGFLNHWACAKILGIL